MTPTQNHHLIHKTIALETHSLLKDAGAEITSPQEKPGGAISFLSTCHNGIINQWEFLPCGTYLILQQNQGNIPQKFNPRGIAGLFPQTFRGLIQVMIAIISIVKICAFSIALGDFPSIWMENPSWAGAYPSSASSYSSYPDSSNQGSSLPT